MAEQADVEFFWDPICPWAWLTSRWVEEVAGQRSLSVDWRFISLAILNADKDGGGQVRPGHAASLKLLRVAASVRAAEGPGAMAALYTRFGGDLHVRGRRDEIIDAGPEALADYLRSAGVAEEHIAAAEDASWDELLRAETEEALGRTGRDVGTPIISFRRDGEQYSFFGPVISRVPRGEEALRLWDAVWEVATFPGLSELKRSQRERPNLADSLAG